MKETIITQRALLIPSLIIAQAFLALIMNNVFGLLGAALSLFLFPVLLLIRNPKHALLLFWIFTIIAPTLETRAPAMFVKATEQLLILYLLSLMVGRMCITKEHFSAAKNISTIFILFLANIGLSIFLNDVPFKVCFYFLLVFLRHFIVFYYALLFLDKRDSRAVFFVIIGTMLLQYFFSALAFAGIFRAIPRKFRLIPSYLKENKAKPQAEQNA